MPYTDEQLCEIAADVLRSNRFITLATIGADSPWVAPLMYAVDKNDNFFWVSAVDAVHSAHLRANRNISLVVFDSDPEFGHAQALYAAGSAVELTGDDLATGCDVFYSMRFPDPEERAEKGRGPADFEGDSPRRMYRAHVEEYSILHPDKHPVFGKLIDYRVNIPFSTSMR